MTVPGVGMFRDHRPPQGHFTNKNNKAEWTKSTEVISAVSKFQNFDKNSGIFLIRKICWINEKFPVIAGSGPR